MQIKSARMIARAGAGLALIGLACGFAFLTNSHTGLPVKWPPGNIPIRIMVDNTTVLSDGNTRATSIQAALVDLTRGWNHNLGNAQFVPVILGPGSGSDGNSVNEVFFSSSPYGMAWDTNTLAVTTDWSSGNQRAEGDTIFNTAYGWDSYRGAEHASPVDLQRVAIHELGHTLGLDHPDEAGQSVASVMNSHVSNTDSLTVDDIAGAQQLYGPPGIPANDSFAAAIPITLSGNSATLTGFNTNASKESGEPNHASNAGGRSVWWKWTAPSTGSVTLTTSGSVFDTTLGVYVGSSVTALTMIVSNDDVQAGVIQYSSVSFSAVGGTTYYFAVDGFNASDGHGADCGGVTLNLTFTSIGGTTSTTSSVTTTTTTTIPPSSGSSGGGGGGGAFEGWFSGALALLWLLRWRLKKT